MQMPPDLSQRCEPSSHGDGVGAAVGAAVGADVGAAVTSVHVCGFAELSQYPSLQPQVKLLAPFS